MASLAFWFLLSLAPSDRVADQVWHCATWAQIDQDPALCETVFGVTRPDVRTV